MILEIFNKSEIARQYFLLKGEDLSKQDALNRFRMIRNFDKKALNKIISEAAKEQKIIFKKDNKD